jgi:hypothetical protein
MSVHPGDRGVSSMQFVETANKIEERAMQVCRKWPKSYTFIITQRTIQLASELYEHVLKANCIFPITTEAEREERLLELQRALGANNSFSRKIERAYHMFPICGIRNKLSRTETDEKSDRILAEFMNLCLIEEDAIKGNITFTRNCKLAGKKQ